MAYLGANNKINSHENHFFDIGHHGEFLLLCPGFDRTANASESNDGRLIAFERQENYQFNMLDAVLRTQEATTPTSSLTSAWALMTRAFSVSSNCMRDCPFSVQHSPVTSTTPTLKTTKPPMATPKRPLVPWPPFSSQVLFEGRFNPPLREFAAHWIRAHVQLEGRD